jgi:hypothetical protein
MDQSPQPRMPFPLSLNVPAPSSTTANSGINHGNTSPLSPALPPPPPPTRTNSQTTAMPYSLSRLPSNGSILSMRQTSIGQMNAQTAAVRRNGSVVGSVNGDRERDRDQMTSVSNYMEDMSHHEVNYISLSLSLSLCFNVLISLSLSSY